MVGRRIKQGDIVKLSFNPQAGHEQAGYRPAVVISNEASIRGGMVVLCPITNTKKPQPACLPLEGGMATTGYVLCDQLRAMDLLARPYRYIETVPRKLLTEIVDTVCGLFDITI